MFLEEKNPETSNKQFPYANQWSQYGQLLSALIPNIQGKSIPELFAMLEDNLYKTRFKEIVSNLLTLKKGKRKAI